MLFQSLFGSRLVLPIAVSSQQTRVSYHGSWLAPPLLSFELGVPGHRLELPAGLWDSLGDLYGSLELGLTISSDLRRVSPPTGGAIPRMVGGGPLWCTLQ